MRPRRRGRARRRARAASRRGPCRRSGSPSAAAPHRHPGASPAPRGPRGGPGRHPPARSGGRGHAVAAGPRPPPPGAPREDRRPIRARSSLILTSPDMLHVSTLSQHRQWGDVLANLAWVVVDEAHVYRGVFGSHVANVLRRLRRLARAYGTEPRFILASATIANPAELAERLTGAECRLVDRDGAPRAQRKVVMWNPPLVDENTGRRASVLREAATALA